MFRRNLFKRFLPVALSVAMTVQSVPVTSYAAETETIETETAAAGESEEASDEQVGNDGEKAQTEEVKSEETKAEETKETSEEVTTEEAKTEETKTEETNKTSEEVTPEDENKASEETKSEEEKIEAQAEEEIENNKAEELPKSEIVLNFDGKKGANEINPIKPGKSEFSMTEESFKSVYSASNEAAQEVEKLAKERTIVKIDTVTDDDERRKNLNVKYQWQSKDDKGQWNDCDVPEVTGEYRIKVSLGETAGLCKAAEDAFVYFTIEKQEITINLDKIKNTEGKIVFDAGIEASEAIAKITEKYNVEIPDKDVVVVKEKTTIKIKEAASGKELAATDKLQDKVSYVVEFNVVLTDDFAKNYKISEDAEKYTFNITTEARNAKVTVETKDGVTLGKKWDGKAITIDDIAKDITSFKVEADEEDNAAKKVLTTDIKDANVTLTWKNGEGVEIDAPSDAGQYILVIDYKDDNYNVTSDDIRVVIDPVDIIVVPELSDADKRVADGDKVDDILKKVTYKVYEVVDGKKSESAMTVDEYFWGEYENIEDPQNPNSYVPAQQYYQPRAIVQVGTKNGDNIDWKSLGDNDKISSDETKQYRVVFAGDLVVYDKDGKYTSRTNTTDKVQLNYRADITDAVKDANNVVLTVAAATEVVIDVSDILKDKKGDSYDNAIISTYNGEGIYASKADYKKAKLVDKDNKTVASDKEKDFTYQWQYIDTYNTDEKKEDGSDRNWYDVEDLSAPCNAGNYRLKITYEHKDDKNIVDNTYRVKEEAYVYYTILPQDAIVEVTGAPAAYADGVTTIGDYYRQARLDNNIGIKLYAYDKATKTAGSEIALNVEEQAGFRDLLTVWVKVEEEGEHKGEFIQCSPSDKFEAGRDYVLSVYHGEFGDTYDEQIIGNRIHYIYNYNLGRDLDKHGLLQSNNMLWRNADKGAKIDVKASQGVEVSISIDTAQIKNRYQEYNGKAFDLSEIKSLVRITNKKTGEDLTAALKDKLTYQFENTDTSIKVYDRYDDSNAYRVADKEIVKDGDVIHGGTYKLVAKMEATDVYAAATNQAVNITITPKELVVTPKVKDEVKAGLTIVTYDDEGNPDYGHIAWTSTGSNADTDSIIADIPDAPDGYIGDDADGVLEYDLYVYNDKVGSSATTDTVLKSGKTYYAEYTNVDLKHTATTRNDYYDASKPITYFDRDYSVRSERVAFTPVRAEASVSGVTVDTNYNTIEAIDNISGSAKDGYVHTITAKQAIPYDKGTRTVDGKTVVKGNEFTIRIEAPKEFDSTEAVDAVFEKAVKAAGGFTSNTDGNTKVIEVTFNAEAKDVKEFDIVWKPGYKETFKVDFTNAKLEANFTQAVAPKSLAFNAVNKNMAVGGTQQLDVKITKKQMSDVILLRYASSDESVLKVSDSGYVTALKNGTATISVFPCYQDKEGKIVRIEGAKAATVKIKVAEVAKPKIKKVSVRGTKADVLYAEPANGYRREIYVLEGKNLKEAAFEAAISAVKNGDYSDFAYVSLDADEDFNSKTATTLVYGLESNTEYTVYVRNVSGLRTLENGATLAVSAAGAVKSFKTTTQENEGLFAYFDLDNTKVYCDDTDDRCIAQSHNEYYNHDYDHAYTIKLSDKKAKLSVDAKYRQNLSYSDKYDYIWRTLPLGKEDQQKYLSPKLEYYVFDPGVGFNINTMTDDLKAGRLSQSKLATVDKKGNVTVKGAGTVYVYAVDRVANKTDHVELNIVAEPNSVKGKNAKLTVGQSIWLSELLTYKEGKNTIEGYQNVDLSIDQQSNEYFKIEKNDYWGWSGDSYTTNYRITPIKAGSKLVINVTDKTVAKNGGAPTKVTITSKDIAAVQNLKVANVTDTDFGIFFTDKADSDVYGYKIEVKDERGNILYSDIELNCDGYYDYDSRYPITARDGKTYESKKWFEMASDNNTCYYDAKANKYTYYHKISDTSINLLSKYTVSVTALYGDDNGYVESKTVSKAVKTTNIPASKNNLLPGVSGGAWIYINTKDKDAYSNSYKLDDINALVSGNKYTLTYSTGNTANVRKTDTLTWKSTNTKVATVKANAGSYSATLKAVKPGKTTIEVTSKITKKVIARYDVYVAASGDAHQYFGDNEPYNWSEFAQLFSLDDAINDGSIIEVIAGAPKRVKIDAMTRQWFMFEAPEYGTYSFTNFDALYKADKETKLNLTNTQLNKGDVVYLYKNNYAAEDDTILVRIDAVESYQEVKVGENAVIAGKNYIFVAPTANYYTFKWLDRDGEEVENVDALSMNPESRNEAERQWTKKAPTGAVKLVISIPATEEIVKAGEEKTIKFEKLDGVWHTFKFVAPEDGIYKFAKPTTSETGAAVGMQLLDSLDEITVGTGESVKTDSLVNNGAAESIDTDKESVKELRKGAVKYIAIKANTMPKDEKGKDKAFECKLSVGQATAVEIGKEATVKVNKNDKTTTYEYASIVIPESGDYKITVTASAEDKGIDKVEVFGSNLPGSDKKTRSVEKIGLKKNQIVKITFESNNTDDVTYTIKAEKLIKDKIKVGDTDVAVAANANKTVELPVTETGIYTITAKGSDGTTTTVDGIRTKTVYYEAGKNAKITINHDKTETVKVTVKKETINPLASGDVSLSKDGETKYFKFTADKEGVYTISIPTEPGKTAAYKADTLAGIVNSTSEWTNVTNKYMAAGEAIYVKMTSERNTAADATNATVKVTVSGGVAEAATLDKEISVDKASTKVVSFVAPKKARYEVTGMTVTKGSGLSSSFTGLDTTKSVVLEAGEKIYFKAVNNDPENSKSFKISEVTTKKADGKDTVSLKNGEGAWFEITAGKDTFYDIIATAKLDGSTPIATMKYFAENDLTNENGYSPNTDKGEFWYIAPNTKAYVYVKASSVPTDKTATVKVEAKAAGADELTKAEGHELNSGEVRTFSTTAAEDGYYMISADNDFSLDSAYVGSKSLTSKFNTVKLSKGDKLTVRIEAKETAKATYKFKLDKLTVLTDKEQDIAVKKGETGYAVVVGKDEGEYIPTWVNGDVTDSGWCYISEIGGWDVVSNYNYNDADVTYKVSVKPAIYEPIKVGDTVTVKSADFKKGTHYYSVDVEANKAYIVKTTNASKWAWVENVDGDYINNNNIEYVIGDLNGKLKIDFTPDQEIKDKDATLTVTEAKAVELKDGQYTIDISKVEPNEPVYLEYTVPEDGEYTYALTTDKDETGSVNDYSCVVKKVGGAVVEDEDVKYFKGNKVLYKVSYTGTDLTKNLTFKVTKTPTQAITKVNEEVTVNVPANGSIKLTYVAASGESPSMTKDDTVTGVSLSGRSQVSATNAKPVTYAWTLSNNNAEAKDVKVKITVPKTDVTLELEKAADVTFDTEKGETSKNVAFTAERAGKYKLTYTDKDGKDKQIATATLAKGQKYVTTVYSDAEVNKGEKISVKVSLVQEATVLELGKQFRGTGVPTLYVFTATTGGEYAVKYTNGNNYISPKRLAAGESYMFTANNISSSTLLSVERTDNK